MTEEEKQSNEEAAEEPKEGSEKKETSEEPKESSENEQAAEEPAGDQKEEAPKTCPKWSTSSPGWGFTWGAGEKGNTRAASMMAKVPVHFPSIPPGAGTASENRAVEEDSPGRLSTSCGLWTSKGSRMSPEERDAQSRQSGIW